MSDRFDSLFQREARRRRQDWRLLKAITARESNFDPLAVNPNDPSYGLMQVSEPTARALGLRGPMDQLLVPAVGIKYGSMALADIQTRHRTIDAQLAVYNGGERGGRPRAYIEGEMRPENAAAVRRYVDGVLQYYEHFKTRHPGALVRGALVPAGATEGTIEAVRRLWPFLLMAAIGFAAWRMLRG